VISYETLLDVLRNPAPRLAEHEVQREQLPLLPTSGRQAVVLTGVRRSGKSTLQRQLRARLGNGVVIDLEDTRLHGLSPAEFPLLLRALDEHWSKQPVFLDEVQEVAGWQRLVRTLLDRGRFVCVTGSNASLLGRELGSKLTGRHRSFEVSPFSYREFLAFTEQRAGAASLRAWLDEGGFPLALAESDPRVLRELLRDVVQRDIAVRHGLRTTRHLMSLTLFLLANTGLTFSLQGLTKSLAIPSVAQTGRAVEQLQDAYLLFALQKWSPSFKKRVVSPAKYYAVDNGLRRANSPQATPDRGHRLENAIYLELRRRSETVHYAGERDAWECDFVTPSLAVQVCAELTDGNRSRELRGVVAAANLPGKRSALVLTLDQADELTVDDVHVDIRPAWQWLLDAGASD
jgi:uncharacterized protein